MFKKVKLQIINRTILYKIIFFITIVILITFGVGTLSAIAETKKEINNPEGLYLVTDDGISHIRVRKKDNEGNYNVRLYVVTSKYSNIRSGDLGLGGWWYPQYQQFYFTQYINFKNRSDCNGWFNEGASWWFVVIPNNKIPAEEGVCSGYEFSESNTPSNRVPIGRGCSRVETVGSPCRIRCIEWSPISNKSSSKYLVRTKKDAYNVYRHLQN